ncbi:MAG: N-acetylglucosamine-6-phosphate deacetylase [Lachnospiraceae bacterium]|nr:N-acetylglucosamine-6-phosphate deacetylase [Lachnospiraceae bacterium]
MIEIRNVEIFSDGKEGEFCFRRGSIFLKGESIERIVYGRPDKIPAFPYARRLQTDAGNGCDKSYRTFDKGQEKINQIEGGKSYDDSGKAFGNGQEKNLRIDGVKSYADEGNASGKGRENPYIIDGRCCYAIPGLIDIHLHGAAGFDFCDESREAVQRIAEFELAHGVTSMMAATMTFPEEKLLSILKTLADYRDWQMGGYVRESQKEDSPKRVGFLNDPTFTKAGQLGQDKADDPNSFYGDDTRPSAGAELVGINMEGPFISREKQGAQDGRFIRDCDLGLFRSFMEAARGLVKIMGLAPEKKGALDFIDRISRDVIVSLAHSDASYEEAMAAFRNGARHVTHLYNAMRPFQSREPGIIGAAADCENVMAELICDGIHVHPATVRSSFRMLGPGRIILISDSMRATGLGDGEYTLGGQAVIVKGKKALLKRKEAIAGSVSTLFDCLVTVVKEMGVPLEIAVAAATVNPAKRLGLLGRIGHIREGMQGDILLLDRDLNLKMVVKKGKMS